jgi:hypothetical protein
MRVTDALPPSGRGIETWQAMTAGCSRPASQWVDGLADPHNAGRLKTAHVSQKEAPDLSRS